MILAKTAKQAEILACVCEVLKATDHVTASRLQRRERIFLNRMIAIMRRGMTAMMERITDVIVQQFDRSVGKAVQFNPEFVNWDEVATAGEIDALPPMLQILRQTAKRTALVGGLQIATDVLHPDAVQWAEQRTATLLQQVSDDTRKVVRETVANAIQQGQGASALSRELRKTVGLHSRQLSQLENFKQKLISSGAKKIQNKVDRERLRLKRYRNFMVARTEASAARNEGKLLAWEQSKVITHAKHLVLPSGCPICQPFSGMVYTLEASRGRIPVHPFCECTWVPIVDPDAIPVAPEPPVVEDTSSPTTEISTGPESQTFVPAQTLEEAQDIAKIQGGVNNVLFDGIDEDHWGVVVSEERQLNQLNKYNQHIADLKERFPNFEPSLERLYITGTQRAHANRMRGYMSIGDREWTVDEMARVRKWEKDNKKIYGVAGVFEKADNSRYTVWHETGHIKSGDPSFGQETPMWKWYRATRKHEFSLDASASQLNSSPHLPEFKTFFGDHVSNYATTNIAEEMAEAFTMVADPKYVRGSLPSAIENIVLRDMLGETL